MFVWEGFIYTFIPDCNFVNPPPYELMIINEPFPKMTAPAETSFNSPNIMSFSAVYKISEIRINTHASILTFL